MEDWAKNAKSGIYFGTNGVAKSAGFPQDGSNQSILVIRIFQTFPYFFCHLNSGLFFSSLSFLPSFVFRSVLL